MSLPALSPINRLPVVVLCARARGCYFDFGDDLVEAVYDAAADARNYKGSSPVVCHPPCRYWGKLAHLAAKCLTAEMRRERDLALFCLEAVRRFGGVLEHPVGSALWPQYFLPRGGQFDFYGGRTIRIHQGKWGHPCEKETWIYTVAPPALEFPVPPLGLQPAAYRNLDSLSIRQREATPPALAAALIDFASRCGDAGCPKYRLRRFPARHVRIYKNTRHADKGERIFGRAHSRNPNEPNGDSRVLPPSPKNRLLQLPL